MSRHRTVRAERSPRWGLEILRREPSSIECPWSSEETGRQERLVVGRSTCAAGECGWHLCWRPAFAVARSAPVHDRSGREPEAPLLFGSSRRFSGRSGTSKVPIHHQVEHAKPARRCRYSRQAIPPAQAASAGVRRPQPIEVGNKAPAWRRGREQQSRPPRPDPRCPCAPLLNHRYREHPAFNLRASSAVVFDHVFVDDP